MTELTLHIGAHKTATTAIQKLLSESACLLEENGMVYPRINWFHHAQHRLAFALKGIMDPTTGSVPDITTEIKALKDTLARYPDMRVIISSEELFSLSCEAIEKLAASLGTDHVRIIACVRRPDELLLSIYNQKAKSPANGFVRMLDYFIKHPRQIDPDINYSEHLGKWIECFGLESISLFTFEERSPVESFFEILGMEAPQEKSKRINRSVSAPVIEVMRLSKSCDFNIEQQRKLFTLASATFSKSSNLFLSDDYRRVIIAEFEEENNHLFKVFGRENPYSVGKFLPLAPSIDRSNLKFTDMMALLQKLI